MRHHAQQHHNTATVPNFAQAHVTGHISVRALSLTRAQHAIIHQCHTNHLVLVSCGAGSGAPCAAEAPLVGTCPFVVAVSLRFASSSRMACLSPTTTHTHTHTRTHTRIGHVHVIIQLRREVPRLLDDSMHTEWQHGRCRCLFDDACRLLVVKNAALISCTGYSPNSRLVMVSSISADP